MCRLRSKWQLDSDVVDFPRGEESEVLVVLSATAAALVTQRRRSVVNSNGWLFFAVQELAST